ncbi:hypothetical protein [Maritimibacter dapengensis]|uniref:Uncharacterized protein n=1 Tax=Maritimibacter dapengensis TaxID=2836868 RepID=A0ABS6T5P6_9RHOB|nr:hypothetical protein [Maritimibacter dapengensis]MBV7380586.1 hypothetical protein [Maritimibacter dapengensis]
MDQIALLAPVPEEHLISALDTQKSAGKVAFGSNAWQVFNELREIAGDQEIDVYIYASDSRKFGPPKVRWTARYLGHVDSKNGAHPSGMTYRPTSTEQYDADNRGHWAVFWEVDSLVELTKDEAIPMNLLSGRNSHKAFVSNFVPHGPTLIEAL